MCDIYFDNMVEEEDINCVILIWFDFLLFWKDFIFENIFCYDIFKLDYVIVYFIFDLDFIICFFFILEDFINF